MTATEKADITVFRPSEAVWYVLRSYNNQLGAFAFGLSDDIPQPGDWNGDGIMEIDVYRPSQNTWYSSKTRCCKLWLFG